MPDFGRNFDRPLTPIREDVNVFFSSSGVINALLTKLLGTKLGDYRPLVMFFLLTLPSDLKAISHIIL